MIYYLCAFFAVILNHISSVCNNNNNTAATTTNNSNNRKSHMSRPLRVVHQPQVPQRPVKMLLLQHSSCAQRATGREVRIAASSCGTAALRHGGEVAEVIGQEPDGVVRPSLDQL